MTTPTLTGLHHVTLAVTDLDQAITWFETVFGARRRAADDHYGEDGVRFAAVLSLPGVAVPVLLQRAADVPPVSHVGLGVAGRPELARWAAHFDQHGVTHSDVLLGRGGHVMTCATPGGSTLVLFADQVDDATGLAGRARPGSCTCSAPPARSASGSCRKSCRPARSARSCSPTPADWADSFGALDFLETRRIPFIVAVNCFDGADIYDQDEIRAALDIDPHVPVQHCDARDRSSSKRVIVRLLEYLMATATEAGS
jgi:catechol 2,3-dioxygenase-like lactoylglutathione lyase family enzyme